MNLLLQALAQPWALEQSVLRALADVLTRHADGVRLSAEEIQAIQHSSNDGSMTGMEIVGDVAVIPIHGVIARHASMVNGISQPRGTSVEAIRADFHSALADTRVQSIRFDVNSPGGQVAGVADLADEIRASAKPTEAYTDGMMASAAYHLMSGVHRIVASRSAMVGSIGVYAALQDTSVEEHNKGRKTILVRSGRFKGAGMPGTHVGDEVVSELAAHVEEFFGMFTAAVMAGRGFTPEQMAAVGDGQVFLARKALEKGLIDAIESEQQFRSRLSNPTTQGAKSMKEPIIPAAAVVAATETPDQSAALVTPAAATPAAPASPAAVLTDPVAVERQRVIALNGLRAAWPSHGSIIDASIADGTSLESCQATLLAAQQKIREDELARLQGEAASPASRAAAAASNNGNSGDASVVAFDAADIEARFKAGEFRGRYTSVAQAQRWERAAFDEAREKRA
jgi:signal peptide peptidase SppA